MQKLWIFIALLALLAGCYSDEEIPRETPRPTETSPTPMGTVSEFFPFKENTLYQYEGENAIWANNHFYFNYIRDNRAQRILTAGTFNATEVLEIKDGELKLVYGDPAYHFYEDIMDANPNTQRVILKEPLTLGQNWQIDEESTGEITNVNVNVETPSGIYEAIEVTITHARLPEQRDYYAKGIGLVKSIYTENDTEIESVLSEMITDMAMQIPTYFHFPNLVDSTMELYEAQISILTNGTFEPQFESGMKQTLSEETIALLTENSRVNFIRIDRNANHATIDLSSAFMEEFNIGDGVQISVLQGITNTIGNFFDVDTVIVTIDEQLFENGSIRLDPGEGFAVERLETE